MAVQIATLNMKNSRALWFRTRIPHPRMLGVLESFERGDPDTKRQVLLRMSS